MDPQPEPLRWLYGLQHFGVKLGLDNIRALLDLLGHPEAAFPSIVVAGTNGKGSVAAMLATMLDRSGLRCGLFTSPHLVRPNERIRIAGRDICDDDLHRLLRELRHRIEHALARGRLAVHPSFFEVVTAAALCAFREARVDAAVLEVGLGGRLDATNAVDADVSVIVTIALDHTKTLGATLARIAEEKAGIVKPSRPLVSGVEPSAARAVLRRVCRERGSPWIETRAAVRVEPAADGSFGLRTSRGVYDNLRLSLAGAHQRHNAAVAVAALETFLAPRATAPDADAVRGALAAVRWPGRLQWVDGDPPLLLDGAHNPAGAAALAGYLRGRQAGADPGRGGALPVLLFGAMRGKDVAGMLAPLAGRVGRSVVTRPGVERSADPREVVDMARHVLGDAELVAEPARALERARARARARPGAYVLVAGSLYLIGEVLGLLERAPVPGPVSM